MASGVRSAAFARIVSASKDGRSLLLSVNVKPGARAEAVCVGAEALEVRVTAQPQDGEANVAVVRAVAELFGVGRSSVAVLRGQTSRHKVLAVAGLPLATADTALARLAGERGE